MGSARRRAYYNNLTMRRSIRSTLIALSPVLVLAACQDAPTAPRQVAVASTEMPDFRITGTIANDQQSADIRVTRTGGWFVLGPHAVYFPRGSICSLESSYGVTEWDKPCLPATRPVDFHVEIRRDVDGRSWLSFSPDVRFVPSKNRSQWVMLYMWAGGSAADAQSAVPTILWTPAGTTTGIDESLTDETLVTRMVPGTSIAYRRVKHFSGFQVGMGREGEESAGEGVTDGAGGVSTESVTP